MSESELIELESQMAKSLGSKCPENSARNIGAALQAAEFLESKGFDFSLADLCPNNPEKTQWRALFAADGKEFLADDCRAPVAVCRAVLMALAER